MIKDTFFSLVDSEMSIQSGNAAEYYNEMVLYVRLNYKNISMPTLLCAIRRLAIIAVIANAHQKKNKVWLDADGLQISKNIKCLNLDAVTASPLQKNQFKLRSLCNVIQLVLTIKGDLDQYPYQYRPLHNLLSLNKYMFLPTLMPKILGDKPPLPKTSEFTQYDVKFTYDLKNEVEVEALREHNLNGYKTQVNKLIKSRANYFTL